MASYVIKPDADRDFYVIWSTVVEAPTAWGTADEVHIYLIEDAEKPYGDQTNQWLRILRADERGSSALWPSLDTPIYGWNHPVLMYQQQGLLPRRRLRELCERIELERDVDDLLEPLDH